MLRKYLLFGGVVFILMHSSSFAYDGNTIHRKINENAVDQSALNDFLGNYLGFSDGVNRVIGTKEVWEWIREGGRTEDEFTRPVNHFHDPLSESWEDAGLPLEVSSLIWAQYYEPAFDPYGIEANIYSWARAREYYYQALTTGSEQGYALTFLSLGQIMHLLSDKAVPAHVRFDIHPPPYWKDPYESWTANPDNKDKINYTGIPVDSSIFNNYVASDSAPVPISALWDQDKYNMPNPDPSVTKGIIPNLAEIGLAEYANANFFSKDTIFDDYPHPAYADTNLGIIDWTNPEAVDAEDGVLDNRIYIYGDAGGTQNIRLAAMGYFSLDCIRAGYNVIGMPILDDKVHEDYASRLIPRAVGYSTALINYFFRGQLEVGDVEVINGIPVINGSGTIVWPDAISLMKADVQNVSTLGDQAELIGPGSLIGIARYVLAGVENYSVSQQITLSQTEIDTLNSDFPAEISFDFSGDAIPAGSSDLSLQVVFKGTLGNELDNGIAVGRSDVSAGSMEVSPPDEYVYGIVDGSSSPHQFNSIRAKVMNTTSSLDELGNPVIAELHEGQLYAVARYREIPGYQEDLSNYPADEAALQALMENEPFVTAQSAIIAIDPLVNPISSVTPTSMTFDFSTEPIPAGVTDLTLHIVFSGAIGDDQELTMAAGTVDLNEPQYLTFANDTDYFLLNGIPVKTEDIIDDPDVELYGQIYPHDFTEELGFSATDQIAPFVVTFASLPPARYSQIIILVDNPSGYYVTDRVTATWNDITWLDATLSYQFAGTVNKEESPGVWQWTPVYTVRDITQHQRMYYMNYYPYFVYINSLPAPPENAMGPYPVTINLAD
ncbi:MAG: hypothetical protein AB1461_18250 [Thermodesulfobacteriota bacterium]